MHRHLLILAVSLLCGLTCAQAKVKPIPRDFSFRVFDHEAEPLKDEHFTIEFVVGQKSSYHELTSDVDGTLFIDTPEAFLGAKKGTLWLQRYELSEADPKVPSRYCGVKGIEFGVLHDTFRVELEESKVLLSGRTVDETGEPLAGVLVRMPSRRNRSPINIREMRSYTVFQRSVLTDEKGEFAIHTYDLDTGMIRPRSRSDTHVSLGHLQYAPGTEGIRLVMRRFTTVHGKILGVPKGKNPSLQARLTPRKLIPGFTFFEADRDQRDGVLTFKQCVAGVYDFTLKRGYGSGTKVLASVKKVVVEAGKPCRDPRLAALDLSQHMTWFELDVYDHEGERLPRVQVKVKSEIASWQTDAPGNRPISFMTSPDGAQLTISAEGFRTRVLEGVTSDTEVRLQLAWRARVTIPNLPKLSASVLTLRLGKQDENHGVLRKANKELRFDGAEHEEVVSIARPGAHVFELRAIPALASEDGDGRGQQQYIVLGKLTVEVKKGQGTEDVIEAPFSLSKTEREALLALDAVLEERTR